MDIYSYSDIYDKVTESFGDIDYFAKRAARVAGPVLELACGTGTFNYPYLLTRMSELDFNS